MTTSGNGRGTPTARWFRDDDSPTIYAVVDSGIFRARPGAAEWAFSPRNSPDWDSTHQRIFWAGRVEELPCNPLEMPLPEPWAAAAAEAPRPWREHFLPLRPLDASAFPAVAARLRSAPERRLLVHVVLSEDLYETRFGDGKFCYLHDVCLDREEARRIESALPGELSESHYRSLTLQLADSVLAFDGFEPVMFDRWGVEEVVAALERRLSREIPTPC